MMRPMPVLLVYLGLSGILVTAQAPTPAPQKPAPAPAPQTPAPSTQTPRPAAPRPAPRAPAPLTITVQVADSSGLPLGNVQVSVQGTMTRDGVTADDGTLKLLNMRAGNYRLRFTREGSITLERDVTVRANEPLMVDVSLSAAPPPPKPAEPPPSPVADKELGPAGAPKLTPIPTFLEKNFIGREGKKDSSLGCTTTGNATLVQLREALLNQVHDDTDEWVYVVAGEGTLKLGGADQPIRAGTFSLVPHTVQHGILPGGRNPLIYVSILTGHTSC